MKSLLPSCLRLGMLASCFTFCLAAHSSFAQRFVGFSSQVQKAGAQNTSSTTATSALTSASSGIKTYTPSGVVRWRAALLADGDFSKAISAKEGETPKTGSLGASFTRIKQWRNATDNGDTVNIAHLQGNFVISLGSQGDTLMVQPNSTGNGRPDNQYAFGQALLLPGSNARAAKSFTGSLLWRPHLLSGRPALQGLGYNVYLNITQTRWGYQSKVEDVRITSMSFGVLYTVFDIPARDEGNSLILQVLANYSLRHISGDVRTETEILAQSLGSSRYWYSGFEPGLIFTVNSLRVSASFPYYQSNIKGFSNGQFIASLGFSTALSITR